MKLIIDIPEETYNDIQSRDWKNGELVFSEEWKAIHKGTPLDGVLQEIRSEIAESKYNHRGEYNRELAFNVCLQIIDKHIKEIEE